MKTHRELDVYKNVILLICEIYHKTSEFPKYEIFGLTSQLRRASVSVAANLSEGAGRGSSKEYLRFIRISLGSLSEMETLIIIADRIEYLSENEVKSFLSQIKLITSQLNNLLKAIQKRIDVKRNPLLTPPDHLST
jgi:four helix bundle protein